MSAPTKLVALDRIRLDGGTQPRAEINQLIVDDYAEAMRGGADFQPVALFFDGATYWLADGFHRFHAARAAGRDEIRAVVQQGSQRDAILYSVGANASHGLRRTNADKRRAIETLVRDPEWSKRSDRWIAEKCGVSHTFVQQWRPQVATVATSKREGLDGKTYSGPTLASTLREALRLLPAADDPRQVGLLEHLAAPTQTAVVELLAEGGAETVQAARAIVEAKARAAIRAQAPPPPDGRYRTLVIDPPWEMDFIVREERQNQGGFEYPFMTEEELRAFPVPQFSDENAHLYLWVTHAHLATGLRLAEVWGYRYQCQMTWIKNVGFTPFSWMYSTEHVLFCRRGNLALEKLGRRLDFTAKVREHSRKPDEFYDLVREVSPGPRIDVFGREKRKGFDVWGAEADKFSGGGPTEAA